MVVSRNIRMYRLGRNIRCNRRAGNDQKLLSVREPNCSRRTNVARMSRKHGDLIARAVFLRGRTNQRVIVEFLFLSTSYNGSMMQMITPYIESKLPGVLSECRHFSGIMTHVALTELDESLLS